MTLFVAKPTGPRLPNAQRGRLGLGSAGVIALVIVILAAITAVVGVWITPHDPTAPNLSYAWIGPDATYWLGYDVQGRDVLSRVLAGARSSMLGPLVVVVVCMTIGVLLALVAAWHGGLIDTLVSSGMDILFAFPAILLAALAAAVFGAGLWPAVVALTIAYTPYVARLLRGAMLQARNQPYIAALEVQGASVPSIWFRHLLPNVLPLVVAQSTILFGYAMIDIAILSYLGLGIQPPAPDWGVMVSENQSGILQGYPLPAFAASVCIVAVVVSMNLLGERLLQASGGRR
ncbi:ABC transporter permease [Mesorhizobium sp. VK23B]|uniref:ABC transporter permease n=1 Tax=Mesorhizobium dulcispinae TaxID=3072316 RepID=A0ABU4X890_9HYPH|nr:MULTISPECIES: ABC transporter permease [unclassified Mesorhizobium]MDX8464628.1 ABC transporter permease [Mesorhizobium sp. VK23B]MDX8471014.1 ABC transporter permease [Mesorhizobium sp. VK23A]